MIAADLIMTPLDAELRTDAQNSAAYNTIRRLMQFSVEQLQHVFDSLEYHVAMFDREWRFTYVNLEAAAQLGRSADELRGRCVWELFPEAVGNEYYRELHDAVATGRIIHSDHSARDVRPAARAPDLSVP